MRRISVVGVLAGLMAVGCGPTNKNKDGIADGVRQPTDVTLTAPSTPTGTISGQVMDTTLAPLSGATVSLVGSYLSSSDGGMLSTTTDSNGNWTFGGVPAGGDIEVTITKSGYGTIHTTANINNQSGNVPQSNANANVGPVTLAQVGSTVKFLVVNNLGKPAQGAKATLEAGPTFTWVNGNGLGNGGGVVISSATADANGILSFAGVPGTDELARVSGHNPGAANYTVTIAALDTNGDGIPDSQGTVRTYSAQNLLTDSSLQVITLPAARTQNGLALLASNVPSFGPQNNSNNSAVANMVKPTDTLYMVFNQFLVNSSITVRLTDEVGKTNLANTFALNSGSVLTITPGAAFTAGKEYNLAVHVLSLDSGQEKDFVGYFFAGDPTATPSALDLSVAFRDANLPSGNGSLDSGETVDILFNQPVAPYASVGGTPALNIVYINKDLDASGKIGDAPGEVGYTGAGFTMFPNEYVAETGTQFVLKASNYTTRYSFTYAGPQVAPGTTFTVDFTKLNSISNSGSRGVQSIWGVPAQSAFSGKSLTVEP